MKKYFLAFAISANILFSPCSFAQEEIDKGFTPRQRMMILAGAVFAFTGLIFVTYAGTTFAQNRLKARDTMDFILKHRNVDAKDFSKIRSIASLPKEQREKHADYIAFKDSVDSISSYYDEKDFDDAKLKLDMEASKAAQSLAEFPEDLASAGNP